MAIGKLIFFLFVLTVGKSPAAVKEFAQIKGEWTVVRAEADGQEVSPSEIADTVSFLSAETPLKQPASSLAYFGKLTQGRTPRRLDLASISLQMANAHHKPGSPPDAPFKQEKSAVAFYQISGNTMKILFKRSQDAGSGDTKAFSAKTQHGETLLELRRKPKK